MIARCALGECNAEPQTVGKSETILNETNQAGQVLVNAVIVEVESGAKAESGTCPVFRLHIQVVLRFRPNLYDALSI